MNQSYNVESLQSMRQFGADLASCLAVQACIELVGDVGAGKTTLVKAVASGLGITEDVSSPSFTISRLYELPKSHSYLAHYDFYRLSDPGILLAELAETSRDDTTITVIEWGETVRGVLPDDRLTIVIQPSTSESDELNDEQREITLSSGGERSSHSARRLAELSVK